MENQLPETLYIVIVNNEPLQGFESHSEALHYVETLEVNKDKDIIEIYAAPYPDPTPYPEYELEKDSYYATTWD